MQSQVINISAIDLRDRLTVEHYLSRDLAIIEKVIRGKHPIASLKEFAVVRGGKRLPSQAQYSSSGIPYVRVVDVGDFEIEMENVVYISEELHNIISRYQLKQYDVAIVIVGATIGKVAIFNSNVNPCNFNENMARITIKDAHVNPYYLLTYLQSSLGQAYIRWLTGGAAQAKLSLERIEKICVPLLPSSTQEVIARTVQDSYTKRQKKISEAKTVLDTIDLYLLEALKVNAASFSKERKVIRSIKRVKEIGRFDFDSVVSIQSVDFNDIKFTKLGDVVDIINDRVTPALSHKDELVSYVGLEHIISNTGELASFTPCFGSTVLSSSPKFEGSDILFGRMRPYLNKVWLADRTGICSGEILVLRPNKRKVDPHFLHALLLSKLTLSHTIPLQSGSSLPRISATDLLSIRLPIPDNLGEQREIGEEVTRRRKVAYQLKTEAKSIMTETLAHMEEFITKEEKVE